MTLQQKRPIPEYKKRIVAEISDLIKNKKTILIASIKDLPASQFQEISKKLRGKAIVKVPKKNLIFRAIDDSGNEAIKKLEEQIQNSVAILFSDLDTFDLAAELMKSKSPARAKPGQIAPIDIEVQAGPTDLVPGPAISELGAVGLQVQIEKGKINIRETKVIVKEGDEISQAAADIMSKLDIKPFSVGFVPLSAFDTKENKLYLDIKIDKEGTLEELKSAHAKALGFAVEIGHPSEDTIKFLIGKAGAHAKALEKVSETKVPEEKVEEKKEEVKEDNKEINNEKSDVQGETDTKDESTDNPKSEDVDNNSNQSPSESEDKSKEEEKPKEEVKPEVKEEVKEEEK